MYKALDYLKEKYKLNYEGQMPIVFNHFSRRTALIEELAVLIGDKKEVKIADIGSGPFSKIGQFLDGVKVEVYASDHQDFKDFWEKYNAIPFTEIAYQDMEKLTYPDNFFDIIHSSNALDHTKNALVAVKEMIRVCKPGGWVYIECYLDQLSTGYLHHWNAKKDGVFTNNNTSFDLKTFGFKIEFIDNGGESRYNLIIAKLYKELI